MKGNAARREGQRGTPRHPKKQAVFLRLRRHHLTLAQASARASASNAPRSRKHFIMHRQVSFYTLWRFGRKDVPFQSLPDSDSFQTACVVSNTYRFPRADQVHAPAMTFRVFHPGNERKTPFPLHFARLFVTL